MHIALLIAIVAGSAALLWLNLLATYVVTFDDALGTFQKTATLSVVWIVPFLGASVVLYFALEHSPSAIPRRWLPWPFTKLIFGDPLKRYTDRSNETDNWVGGDGSSHGADDD